MPSGPSPRPPPAQEYSQCVFETFTEQAREAIECAQNETRDMGHGAVQVERLLLGLASELFRTRRGGKGQLRGTIRVLEELDFGD